MKKVEIWLGRSVLAGLIAGVVGAALANLTFVILTRHFGPTSDQLNWFSITRASIIACFLGAFAYYAFARWTAHPVVWFVAAGLAVATVDSVLVALYPPDAGFARIANPIHFAVTFAALILIPTLSGALPGPTLVVPAAADAEATPTRKGPPPLPAQA